MLLHAGYHLLGGGHAGLGAGEDLGEVGLGLEQLLPSLYEAGREDMGVEINYGRVGADSVSSDGMAGCSTIFYKTLLPSSCWGKHRPTQVPPVTPEG